MYLNEHRCECFSYRLSQRLQNDNMNVFRLRGTDRTHQRPQQLIHLLPLVSQQNPQVSNLTNQKRNVPQWQVLRFESMPDIWLKVTNDVSAVQPNMKQCHVLNVNFPLVCGWAGRAVEVMVVSYFWRGCQQPCDIGLIDRTSVALNTPLTLLGQAFLSVSRHKPPPIIYLCPLLVSLP